MFRGREQRRCIPLSFIHVHVGPMNVEMKLYLDRPQLSVARYEVREENLFPDIPVDCKLAA